MYKHAHNKYIYMYMYIPTLFIVCIRMTVKLLYSACSCVCSVEWLVLDEADKLFENSPNDSGFREQVYNMHTCKLYMHVNENSCKQGQTNDKAKQHA